MELTDLQDLVIRVVNLEIELNKLKEIARRLLKEKEEK